MNQGCDSALSRICSEKNVEREVLALLGKSKRPPSLRYENNSQTKNFTVAKLTSSWRFLNGVYKIKNLLEQQGLVEDRPIDSFDYSKHEEGAIENRNSLKSRLRLLKRIHSVQADEFSLITQSDEIICFQETGENTVSGKFLFKLFLF